MGPIQLSRLQIIVPFQKTSVPRMPAFSDRSWAFFYKCRVMQRTYLLTSSQKGKEMRNYLAVYRSLSSPRSGSLLSFRDSYLNAKFQSAFLQSRFTSEHLISPIPDICHEPHEYIRVNFFFASVNFYRFNVKNWRFTVYFAVITQKNGNFLCIL